MADKKVPVTRTPLTPSSAAARPAASTVRKEVYTNKQVSRPLFYKENYMWMAIGAVVIGLGMILMSGGKTADVNQFDYKEVYSARRITLAPILILLGLMTEIYAIFKKPKVQVH